MRDPLENLLINLLISGCIAFVVLPVAVIFLFFIYPSNNDTDSFGGGQSGGGGAGSSW